MREWEISEWADDFQPVFWAAKRALTQAAEAAFAGHGVREGQQFVLLCLWREDGLPPGEIARRLGLATPTVTRTTSRMEAAGLVARRPHPTDARLVLIHLTERGWALRETLNAEARKLSERALHGLDADERREFVRMLDVLRRNLAEG
ncbi:MarR family winged helix-turn-helix transcriptional regulator [Streptoalloteichus hindustanus]|uniref:Transcriptional regulator, MarR family n=1 Tax=Streptoalloteichus hindustanus TaxID=2017 RepID=A0A1M5B892_STRHI|nr:MarR family transcriptional regulator [Streptoalloteichus hindustanus]SHF38402.1 transcriptional regulator, MarR family [Streptoalloteichus hindustanus]